MRTLSEPLKTAHLSLSRRPVTRVTIRDVRLRFGQDPNSWFFTDNPYTYQDDRAEGRLGDSVTTSSGNYIVRVLGNYVQRVTVGAAPDSSRWTSLPTWQSLVTADAGVSSGLYSEKGSSTVSLFYMQNGVVKRIQSTNEGSSWGAATQVDDQFSGQSGVLACLAPVSHTVCYIAYLDPYRSLVIERLDVASPNTRKECPWSPNSPLLVNFNTPYYCYNFDTWKVGSREYLVYTNGFGVTRITWYENGAWGNPKLLVPDDYTDFVPHRAAAIDGKVWLTGRITRSNTEATFSPSLDVYLYSDDGEHFSAMARDCFISTQEIRGKLHLAGGYVYCVGNDYVTAAKSTYLINPTADPSDKKLVLTDRLLEASVRLEVSGGGGECSLTIDNSDGTFTNHALLRTGAEVFVEAGYLTSSASREDDYTLIFHGGIDRLGRQIGQGQHVVTVSAREINYKLLKDYLSMFWHPLNSQLKVHDECESLGTLTLTKDSAWRAKDVVVDPPVLGTAPIPIDSEDL